MTAVPDWFLTLCQAHLSLAAVRVGLAIYETGRDGADTDGYPIIHCQLTLDRICELTDLDIKSVRKGVRELEALVGLTRHPALRYKTAWGSALPVFDPLHRPATRVPKSGPQNEANGKEGYQKVDPRQIPLGPVFGSPFVEGGEEGSNPHSFIKGNVSPPPPPAPPSPEVVGRLRKLGAADPQLFLEHFDPEVVEAWVEWMLEKQQAGRFKNPAGFVYRMLQEGKPAPPTQRQLDNEEADRFNAASFANWEARRTMRAEEVGVGDG